MSMAKDNLGKVRPLNQAISQNIVPGMKLHIAGGIGGAGRAICEIIRQFYGTKPGFTLIQSTVTGHAINLLACNLIKKMIFSACVDISPSGRPSKIMQQKWADKSVEFENWSLCSLQQRLMAGAIGIPFIPTRSISRSQMSVDNAESFKDITDPFGSGTKTGVVQGLSPDISIVHGCVADIYGNTILTIPYGDDIWGPLASRNGILVTVEKIVSPDVIKKHAALVKIPGHLVKAVSIVPMGVHPFSLANPGLENFNGYESDVEFLQNLHKASLSPEGLNTWIKEWVLDCPSPEVYLDKLGAKKVQALQQIKYSAEKSKETQKTITTSEYTEEEMMVIVASREITKCVESSGLKVVLLGAGSSSMAVILAYHSLKNKGYDIELISGNGQYGYDPLPGEVGLQSLAGVYASKMVTDTITSQGVIIGGKNNLCLGVIGAGQIDKFGNINSTLTSNGQFLVGSGGANDVGNAREVVVIINQSKDRFVETLPYITCPGTRITTVVSNLGIYKKPIGKEELMLTAGYPNPKLGLPDRIKQIKDQCAWTLKFADKVEDLPPPLPEELTSLRQLTSG